MTKDFALFEKYDLRGRLGNGGQGSVWLAYDRHLHRMVAMKRINLKSLESASVVLRFRAEAQITSQLMHPGILAVFDIGEEDMSGRPFFTMQLFGNHTLWDHFKPGLGPGRELRDSLNRIKEVCNILAYAHNKGVTHRDIKPDNILVGDNGDIRIVDWGSAGLDPSRRGNFNGPFIDLSEESVFTSREADIRRNPGCGWQTIHSGRPKTIVFSPPEVLGGVPEEFSPTTDIYAVGVMLFLLLVGKLPYSKLDGTLPDDESLLKEILAGPPRRIREIVTLKSTLLRRISMRIFWNELMAISEKAMAYNSKNRYQTVGELAKDITNAMEHKVVSVRLPRTQDKILKWVNRNPILAVSITSSLLIVTTGLLFSAILVNHAYTRELIAKQLSEVHSGEVAAHRGDWHTALQHWDNAGGFGEANTLQIALMRADAWTALNHPDKSGDILVKLMGRSDLGIYRVPLLLRMADHELFDPSTVTLGIHHAQEAIRAGAEGADANLAQGLITNSVPGALECFQRTLRLDPYSHAAHVHSLAMELFLARHQDLAEHIRLFSILYPEDPSAPYIEATELALSGDAQRAIKSLERLKPIMNENSWSNLTSGYQKAADGMRYFELEDIINTGHLNYPLLEKLLTESANLLAESIKDGAGAHLRQPHLPCFERSLADGMMALQALDSPFYADITPFVLQIKDSFKLCPGAILPFRAALALEKRQPRNGPVSLPLRQIQAELLQMAADSPSFVPRVPRAAQYLASKMHLDMIQAHEPNGAKFRQLCLRNLRVAAASEGSPTECRAFFAIAYQLSDWELCREFLGWWKKGAPEDPDLWRSMVETEVMAGNLEEALKLLDDQRMIANDSTWSHKYREVVADRLKTLLVSSYSSPSSSKKHDNP